MDPIDRFDPFNNRLCRNVRNALSDAFRSAIGKRDLEPVRRVARVFLDEAMPGCVADYIHQRLKAYQAVLTELDANGVTAPVDVALVIWDRWLFFETHEFLEPCWMAADGDEKRLLQALIRAAGTYVHLEQGNFSAARRIADKALSGLATGRDRLAVHADPQRLIDALNTLEPVPPALCGTAGSAESSSGK